METGLILTGDEGVVLGDEAVSTTDEMVETTDEAVQSPVVTLEMAVEELLAAFGPLVDADYLEGKTGFRDALCDCLGLSEVESEELVDSLEGSGQILFIASQEGFGWRIAHGERGA